MAIYNPYLHLHRWASHRGGARGLLVATLWQLPPMVGRSAAPTHLGTAGISGALLRSGGRRRGFALEAWENSGDGRHPVKSPGGCGENMRQMPFFWGEFVDIWCLQTMNLQICRYLFGDDC